MTKRRCPGLTTHFRFLFLNVAIFNDVIRSNPCLPGAAEQQGQLEAVVQLRSPRGQAPGEPREGAGARLSELMILLFIYLGGRSSRASPAAREAAGWRGNLELCFGVTLKWRIKQTNKQTKNS